MVVGIGTDILLIDRIRQASLDMTDAFVIKTFTENEQAQAVKRNDTALFFATRFAGKEAVFKSLNTDGSVGSLKQIEILSDENDRPYVTLHGAFQELAQEKGIIDILISLSNDSAYVSAFAVAQSK